MVSNLCSYLISGFLIIIFASLPSKTQASHLRLHCLGNSKVTASTSLQVAIWPLDDWYHSLYLFWICICNRLMYTAPSDVCVCLRWKNTASSLSSSSAIAPSWSWCLHYDADQWYLKINRKWSWWGFKRGQYHEKISNCDDRWKCALYCSALPLYCT